MDLGLAGKIAIITGAGSGIGAAIAQFLAAEGAVIAVTDIAPERAASTVATIQKLGGTAQDFHVDVTSAEAVTTMVDHVTAALGPAAILVNNAGFTRDMRITKMAESDWDAVIDVILKGAYLASKAALPAMIEQGWGRIINISSRAHLGNPGQANYSAAKAGLLGFTRALALENGKFGITVNAVAPGIVRTEAILALPHFDKIRENAEKQLPIARLGEPEDVAAAVAFLASEAAGYISGEVLHVTGGRY